jgi:phosphoglycerate dehydrogenase-like enzyme
VTEKNKRPRVIAAPYPKKLRVIFSPKALDALNNLVDLHYLGDQEICEDELSPLLGEDVVAVIGQVPLPEKALAKMPHLRGIFNVEGNFYQNIDYGYCFRNHIHVLNCGSAYALPVAEMALGMALDLARGISREDRRFRQGKEGFLSDSCGDSVLLSGSEVGIIGFGNLGKALAKLLQPFGCSLTVYDPWLPESVLREYGCRGISLEELLEKSRFIFVMAGVTEENQGFLSRKLLERIRKDAFFLLMSRAAVVDFDALCDLTEAGRFTAATDVFPEEPLPRDHRARKNEHLLLSAHRAGGIPQAYTAIGDMVLDDLRLLLQGLPSGADAESRARNGTALCEQARKRGLIVTDRNRGCRRTGRSLKKKEVVRWRSVFSPPQPGGHGRAVKEMGISISLRRFRRK